MSYAAEREEHRASGRPLEVLSIQTRVPSKWRLVDMETGEVWRWREGWRDAGLVAATAKVLAGLTRDRDAA
jgi:hypothetical protein